MVPYLRLPLPLFGADGEGEEVQPTHFEEWLAGLLLFVSGSNGADLPAEVGPALPLLLLRAPAFDVVSGQKIDIHAAIHPLLSLPIGNDAVLDA